jgi:hypothetical protein
MAFSWTDTITTSVTYIKAIHFSELQTNIDWLNDNPGCASNNSVDNTSDNGTVDSGDDTVVNASQYLSYDSGDDGTVDSGDYSSDDIDENYEADAVENSYVCGVNDYLVNATN